MHPNHHPINELASQNPEMDPKPNNANHMRSKPNELNDVPQLQTVKPLIINDLVESGPGGWGGGGKKAKSQAETQLCPCGAVAACASSISVKSRLRSTTSTNGEPLVRFVTTQIVGVC